MKELLVKAKDQSFPFILGATLPAIISLNIFATQADLQHLRATIAEEYVAKSEYRGDIVDLKQVLQRTNDKLDRLIERLGDK